jgi:protein subunit release factor B
MKEMRKRCCVVVIKSRKILERALSLRKRENARRKEDLEEISVIRRLRETEKEEKLAIKKVRIGTRNEAKLAIREVRIDFSRGCLM